MSNDKVYLFWFVFVLLVKSLRYSDCFLWCVWSNILHFRDHLGCSPYILL